MALVFLNIFNGASSSDMLPAAKHKAGVSKLFEPLSRMPLLKHLKQLASTSIQRASWKPGGIMKFIGTSAYP